MNERRPSQTSSLVAFLRALGNDGFTSVEGFSDPTAEPLLPRGWRLAHRAVKRRLAHLPPARIRPMVEWIDMLPLRISAIDQEIRQAVAQGCRQLVILGAGLDGRAHRMQELADATVFEVDHPATQSLKRKRASELPRRCADLVYVAVDFESDSLAERLAACGHRADETTVWVWEGVTMYLTEPALRSTLAAIAGRSAPGSVALVHYHEKSAAELGLPLYRTFRGILRLWSEPQIGFWTREQIADFILDSGLAVASDEGAADWAARFGAHPPPPMSARSRLAVARKTA